MNNQTNRIVLTGVALVATMTALSQTKPTPKSLGVFELTQYERKETFAGKLGNRVKEKLTLKQAGKQYTLTFSAFHTRVAGQTVKPFCPGCPVEVKRGKILKSTVVAERKDVIQLHEKDSKGHLAGKK
jgi:hypothetical protein